MFLLEPVKNFDQFLFFPFLNGPMMKLRKMEEKTISSGFLRLLRSLEMTRYRFASE